MNFRMDFNKKLLPDETFNAITAEASLAKASGRG